MQYIDFVLILNAGLAIIKVKLVLTKLAILELGLTTMLHSSAFPKQ